MNLKSIKVFINNINRLNFLKKEISWLESQGMENIFIIDNGSTYEPLLEYYKKTPHKVIYLNENVGYLSIWESGILEKFEQEYYIYTDPDILPVEECPNDWLELMFESLTMYKDLGKVGFSLKIDDLPDIFKLKTKVIYDESKFYEYPKDKNLYKAMIDTTFALYKPGYRGGYWVNAARTKPPYTARHLPWYLDYENLDEEQTYYLKNIKPVAYYWSSLLNKEIN